MKKARAARSASETQLRSKATSYIGHGAKRSRVAKTVTAVRLARALDKATAPKTQKIDKRGVIDVEEVTPSSRSANSQAPGRQFVPSERVPRQVSGGRRAPAALPAPSPAPKAGPKKPRGPKKEKTPKTQTVFKATPVVDLNEGPNFGNIIHSIEKTEQPKQPRKPKNA